MVGIKKLGCLGVLSRKTSKNPKRMNLTRRVSGRTHMNNLFPQRSVSQKGHKIVRLDTQQSFIQSCLSLPFAVNIKLKCFFRQKNKSQSNTEEPTNFSTYKRSIDLPFVFIVFIALL